MSRSEITAAKNYIDESGRDDIEDIKKNILPQIFPDFYKMIQLALTLGTY
jgi:hypothetical protein